MKEYKLIKSVAIALLTCMFGFGIMGMAGWVEWAPKPLFALGSIIGGFVFGIGMVLAAGCASGTTYRVGEGMMGSFVALLGLAIGAFTTAAGALSELKTILQSNSDVITVFGDLTPLFSLLIGIIGLGVTFYFWVFKAIKAEREKFLDFSNLGEKIFKKGWSWYTTGYLIGILNIVAWILSKAAGRNYPLGITKGWFQNLQFLVTGDATILNWGTWLVIGVVLGGLIAALIAGEFKLRTPKEGKTILLQFVGGFIMGFGAVTAGGCNIGNLLSGIPQLSIGSIVASAGIVLGCWLMAFLLFREKDE